MRLGELRDKDIPQLYQLYCQLIGEEGNIDILRKRIKEVEGDSHYRLFCVFDDLDQLVATASLSKCFDLTGDTRYYFNMENFVVDQNCRHQGYGSFLMKQLEKYVSEHNGSYMNFTSSISRKDAHEFYKREGYPTDYVVGFKKRFKPNAQE